MKSKTFNFHSDPGHAWLEVDIEDIVKVGLKSKDISGCSYHDAHRVYLEEDCDAPKFLEAWRGHGYDYAFREVHSNEDSFVRDLPSIGD